MAPPQITNYSPIPLWDSSLNTGFSHGLFHWGSMSSTFSVLRHNILLYLRWGGQLEEEVTSQPAPICPFFPTDGQLGLFLFLFFMRLFQHPNPFSSSIYFIRHRLPLCKIFMCKPSSPGEPAEFIRFVHRLHCITT